MSSAHPAYLKNKIYHDTEAGANLSLAAAMAISF